MIKYRDWLNEITITELKDIETNYGKITWNKNKSFQKFKSQIEDRIKTAHMTQDYLYKILEKGINLKFNDCHLGSISEDDDTCLIYSRSQFIVIFNRAGKFIRSIRKSTDLDKIMCKTKRQIFECKYGVENELTNFIEEFDVNLDDIDEGYKFTSVLKDEDILLEVQKMCVKCLQIDL